MRDYVKTNRTRSGYVAVDSQWTMDYGYESMAFECDKNGNTLSWCDLDCERYVTEEEMAIGHENMLNRFREN